MKKRLTERVGHLRPERAEDEVGVMGRGPECGGPKVRMDWAVEGPKVLER